MSTPTTATTKPWLDDASGQALCNLLAEALRADGVCLLANCKLSGGAIQENRLLDLAVEGGGHAGRQAIVLRTDAPSGVSVSLTRAQEFAVLRAARDAGVRVPEPILLHEDAALLGAPFYLMGYVAGEARGRRLVRDDTLDGEALVADAAGQLAKLHAVEPPRDDLPFLARPLKGVAPARVAELRRWLDDLPEPQPVLEWGLRWLERNPPTQGRIALIHADFRTGNFLVADGAIAAVLDWEFARWGDPREDLGWFLAKCWRFGRTEREAGGLGSRKTFLDAYVAASLHGLDRASLTWFEVLATIRWAVIALMQTQRHRSGRERSLELALTAHVVPPLEIDILQSIDRIMRRAAA